MLESIRPDVTTCRAFSLGMLLLCLILLPAPASAFHASGVAACSGCHTMHSSEDGVDPSNAGPTEARWLLKSPTPSDVCLSCHATQLGSVLGVDPLNPPAEMGAGNFVFLLENNLNDAPNGALNPIPGAAAGHNIISFTYGISKDSRFMNAPGGTFPSNELSCTSCHDPHGNTNFRMLYGAGPVQGGIGAFMNPAPVAVGLDVNIPSPETNSNHTAYLSGISAWCANCHGDYHDEGGSDSFEHPGGENLEGEIVRQYNRYNGTDSPNSGVPGYAYLAAVPFEDPLAQTSSTLGPSSQSRVMCLTCHRAHASSAPSSGRWDFNVPLLIQDGLQSGTYPIPDPYNSPNQTGLCYKCHPSGSD